MDNLFLMNQSFERVGGEQEQPFWPADLEFIYDNGPLGNVLGGEADQLKIHFQPEVLPVPNEEFLVGLRPDINPKDIPAHLAELKAATNFEIAHGKMEFVKDLGLHVLSKSGLVIPYIDQIKNAQEKSGEPEAATFGYAHFGDQKSLLYAMNFNFRGGSVGLIAGEKMLAAAQKAKREKLPLVAVFSTGGMRQDENMLSLMQMPRGVEAVKRFTEETGLPFIAVLLGPVYGGTSASVIPLASVIIGVKGSNFGFAGQNVIGAYQGEMPPKSSQSAEANFLNRYVDLILEGDEIPGYIQELLSISASLPHQAGRETSARAKVTRPKTTVEQTRAIGIDGQGFAPALYEAQDRQMLSSKKVIFPERRPLKVNSKDPDNLYEIYQSIISDPGRPDGEFLIRNVFDEAVPLYSRFLRDNTIHYPPIISAYATIDGQPFFVAANQPSYMIRSDNTVRKLLSTPRPEDYARFIHQMEDANRRGYPAVTLTATLGAAPTIEAERRGQSFEIARSMAKLIEHRKPVISVVTEGLGSGGGMATTAVAPKFFMLDSAQAYVAEPSSAVSILMRTATPEIEYVKALLGVFESSPEALKQLKLPVEIVPSDPDPYVTSQNLRYAITNEYHAQAQLSEKQLRNLRRKAMYKIGRDIIKYTKAH